MSNTLTGKPLVVPVCLLDSSAHEASLAGSSIFEQLVESAMHDSVANSGSRQSCYLRTAHEQAFIGWLACSPEQQYAELIRFVRNGNVDRAFWLSADSYNRLVPSSIPDCDRKLFACQLRVLLAIARAGQSVRGYSNGCRIWEVIARSIAQHASTRVTLKGLGAELRIDDDYLGCLFASITGVHFRSFLQALRICKVTEALRSHLVTVKEVASIVGYGDVTNFVREFRRVLGMSPMHWRQCTALNRVEGELCQPNAMQRVAGSSAIVKSNGTFTFGPEERLETEH